MIIPVRVPATARPVLAGERRFPVPPGHPLHGTPCPACDLPLGYGATVLVLIGIEPGPGGAVRGKGIAVHASCAGVREQEPETPPSTVSFDITDPDDRHVVTQALDDYAEKHEGLVADGHDSGKSTRWAAAARRFRDKAAEA